MAKGAPNHPIGVVLLARLAVNEAEKKSAGLVSAPLKYALLRSAAPPKSSRSKRFWF